MVQRNQKLFVIMCLSPGLIFIAYWVFSVRPEIATTMFSKKVLDAIFPTMTNFKCNLNVSIGIKADEFIHTMKRHSERNGHGIMKTYNVSDSYGKHGVNNSLSCWGDSTFGQTFEENCQFIQRYPFGDLNPYLQELALAGNFADFPNPKIPVFVTAASSNHFLEVQAQIQNLHNVVFPNYIHLKFIFYDIGLSEAEKEMVKILRTINKLEILSPPFNIFSRFCPNASSNNARLKTLLQLKKHCRCEYRSFPFEKYPEHVKVLNGYTFKPLIVQAVLNEYGFILWMDTSVRFRTGKLDTLFKMAIKDGIKLIEGDLGVGYRTDPVTFKFLGEDPCLFADKNEIQATFVLLYRTRFTLETILRPWVSCALLSGCMYFPGSQDRLSCINQKGLGFCHRFDQSILSIILWRLYHADFGRILIHGSFFDIQKGQIARYFESFEIESNL